MSTLMEPPADAEVLLPDHKVVNLQTRRPLFHHLLWKDFRMAKPLLVAGTACTIALFIGVAILNVALGHDGPGAEAYWALWILMPNLVALGLPPILIGTENEERTFDWVRTLPVSWRQIITSKLLISLGVWLVELIVATLVFTFFHWVWSEMDLRGSSSYRLDASDVLNLLIYGFGMLLVGFVTSLAIRNPIYAVLLVGALMVVLTFGVQFAWQLFLTGHLDLRYPTHEPTSFQMSVMIIAGLAAVASSFSLLAGLARRRLAGPCDERVRLPKITQSVAPLSTEVSLRHRPSPASALLWQQIRQTRWPLICILLGLFLLAIAHLNESIARSMGPIMGGLILPIAQMALGVLAVVGDRMKPRQGFFADRGLSPTLVWATRVAPPFFASLLILFGFLCWVVLLITIAPNSLFLRARPVP